MRNARTASLNGTPLRLNCGVLVCVGLRGAFLFTNSFSAPSFMRFSRFYQSINLPVELADSHGFTVRQAFAIRQRNCGSHPFAV